MRNAGVYLLSVVLVAGALSAVVSMATVTWLYPKRSSEKIITETLAAPAAAPSTAPAAAPVASPSPAPAATAEEKLALDLVRKAAAGDLKGAAALAAGLTPEMLQESITRHGPAPQRTALLPAPKGTAEVLVWVALGPKQTRSLYRITVAGGKVKSLSGPMAPEAGYGALPVALLDEQARPLDMSPHRGRALLLVSPRTPEPGLAELLNQLQATFAPKGIDVALVMDIRSPDWIGGARAAGYKGPIWRVKARLEDVPLVSKGTLLGAYGVLVDREGYAVASLAALEPLHYSLPDETPLGIAPVVFRAYGLMP